MATTTTRPLARRVANGLRHPARLLRTRLAPAYLGRRLRLQPRADIVRIGSNYGGWQVPSALFGSDSICYSAGAGEDVTFDLGLIQRFGCEVWAFDPTPRSIAYVEPIAREERRLHFQAVGLWSAESVQRFYAPVDPTHVSHSIVNLRSTDTYFEAPCQRLSTIMAENGHRSLDLLKLDIEGAEYTVLQTLFEDEVRPLVIAVEFDQPAPLQGILEAGNRLIAFGYELVAVDRWNYTFVRK